MTPFNSLFFFYFVLLISSCININDDDSPQESDCWTPPTALPENDGLGEHVAFFRNDTIWVTTQTRSFVGTILSEGAVVLTYNLSEVSNSLVIRGHFDVEDGCIDVFDKFLLYILDPQEGTNDSIGVSTRFSMVNSITGQQAGYRMIEDESMQIMLDKFNLNEGRAEGTFEFNMLNEDNDQDTLRIRNGRFEGNIL